MKIARIFRDYRETAGVNSLLAVWGFLDEFTFITKAGDVGCLFRVTGVDYEGLTYGQRAALTHRVEAALRVLDERYILYQYVIKRVVGPFTPVPCRRPLAQEAMIQRTSFLNGRRQQLYRSEHYVALLLEGGGRGDTSTRLRAAATSPREAIQAWLSGPQTCTVLATSIDVAVATLHQDADAFAVQLADFGVTKLRKAEAFTFLRELVNVDPALCEPRQPGYDTHLDYFLADSAVECQPDHLTVGSRLVKVLSMKEPPARTYANLSAALMAIPGELTACLEWRRLPNDRARRDIKNRQRHFFNSRVSMVNYVSPDARPDEMLVDKAATAVVGQLGDALTELEVNGRYFGSCSLTLALVGDDVLDLRARTSEAIKVLAAHDGSFFDETYNLLNAWLSMVPGNAAHNLRRLALLDSNLADLSLLFALDGGVNDSRTPPLATFETPHRTTFAYGLHVQDVGHTLVLGATGSGKSFLLNFLVTHAQQFDPLTVVLDLGHSYRTLAELLDGQHLEVGLKHSGVRINPFAFEPTPEQLHFLHAFVRVLLEGEDGYRLSEREDREVYEAIENLYVLDRGQHRLFTLASLLPRSLSIRLHKWVEGGRYASLFDNVDDTLSIERFQVIDFEAMRGYPVLLEPLLFYILHRITERIQDPRDPGLKLCVMDEAWRFIQHPTLRAYVQEGLKTWRKRNAAMILATQAVEDFASTDLLRTVVESCPTKLLLANPSLEAARYAELFQLNEMELDLLADLVPRQQVLLKRPGLSKVLSLNVDSKSHWIYSNSPKDDEHAAAVGSIGRSEPSVVAVGYWQR